MEYTTRRYPQFSVCGLNCGLCPRYHTDGASRCPGCAGVGFSEVHPPCSVLSCCQRKGLEYCFLCDEYPCEKFDSADVRDSFITHRNQFIDMEKAKNDISAYKAELDTKIQMLEELLSNYNDGRRKGLFCIAVNLLDQTDVTWVMEQLKNVPHEASEKEKAVAAVRLVQAKADEKGIDLKLRK